MKLILETWRSFLNEEVQDKYQIFLDMDGVLVDMTQGVVDTVNTNLHKVRNGASTDHNDPGSVHPGSKSKSQALRRLAKEMEKEGRTEITAKEFDHMTDLKDAGDEGFSGANKQIERYFLSAASRNHDWWKNLPILPHAQALVDLANAMILSAPIDDDSVSGKQAWVENNLSGIDMGNVVVVPDKGGYLENLGLPDSIIPILIDDRKKYQQQFGSVGGRVLRWNVHNPEGSFDKAAKTLNDIISKKND